MEQKSLVIDANGGEGTVAFLPHSLCSFQECLPRISDFLQPPAELQTIPRGGANVWIGVLQPRLRKDQTRLLQKPGSVDSNRCCFANNYK